MNDRRAGSTPLVVAEKRRGALGVVETQRRRQIAKHT